MDLCFVFIKDLDVHLTLLGFAFLNKKIVNLYWHTIYNVLLWNVLSSRFLRYVHISLETDNSLLHNNYK